MLVVDVYMRVFVCVCDYLMLSHRSIWITFHSGPLCSGTFSSIFIAMLSLFHRGLQIQQKHMRWKTTFQLIHWFEGKKTVENVVNGEFNSWKLNGNEMASVRIHPFIHSTDMNLRRNSHLMQFLLPFCPIVGVNISAKYFSFLLQLLQK